MNGKIFLIQDNNELQAMSEEAYDSEEVLQLLLEKYPDLLAGEQVNPDDPRRWLLVSREVGIPGEEGGGNRWSVDHLFLDQDGIPTLVEVKRSSDTRIRREVVGQMLDYAANALKYWPVERIRAEFEARVTAVSESPENVVKELLSGDQGPSVDTESFWEDVKTNLSAGKVRMVFVADVIPQELRRIVEFLNVQMNPAEVLALEVRQYVGDGIKTLVPKVIGQTTKVGPPPKRRWDEASLTDGIRSTCGARAVEAISQLLEWAKGNKLRLAYGEGGQNGSCYPMFDLGGKSYYTFAIWTQGYLEFQFKYMATQAPFDSAELLNAFLNKLNTIPGVLIPADRIDKFPTIKYSWLQREGNPELLLEVMDWYLEQIRQVNAQQDTGPGT